MSDAIWNLDNEYGARKDTINDGENARNKTLESQFDLSNRDGRAAFLRACGDQTRRLHAENRAWYLAEREQITGKTYEQEMAEHDV